MITDLPQWFILSSIAIVVLLYKARQSRSTPSKLPLPPSPPGYPIIGNFLDVPTTGMEPAFRDINAKHGTFRCPRYCVEPFSPGVVGEIVYLNACGQPMIVLGSHQAAIDLLEKRSSNYSDRLFSCVAAL